QRARFSGVVARIPPAIACREPTWVRSGPTIPPDTPWTEWQPTHGPVLKTWSPAAAVLPSGGAGGGAFWRGTQASKSAGGAHTALIRMLAGEAPQNSAHCPG